MKTTTTLENVISTVHEESAGHYDEIVPVTDMIFSSLEQMDIAGSSFSVHLQPVQPLRYNPKWR